MKAYRVQGFTCTNCAAIFESNVKELNGVEDAKVNFGAAKVYVKGNTTIEELEKAGSFENLRIRDDNERREIRKPFWKQKENINVYIAAVLLILSWFLSQMYGEGHNLPAAGYAASILIGGYSLFLSGFKNLSKLNFDMNTLMTIAVIGAALIGEWGEAATVVILFAISEAMERYSMDKARQSIELLMDIAPNEALIRRGDEEMMIHVDDVQVGDMMIIKPGQKLAMDGIVMKGTSTINQAAITGESVPVTKTVDDEVFAGTMNEEGLLEVKVTKRAQDTTLTKIIHLVEEEGAIQTIAFDKTGTLTKGFPAVTDIITFDQEENESLKIMAAIERGSQHPLASAIISKAEERGLNFQAVPIEEFQSITGKGVQANINNQMYYVSSPNLFDEIHGDFPSDYKEKIIELQTERKTVIILGTDKEIPAFVAITDEVRESSKEVIRKLNNMDIETVMLTGDNKRTGTAIGKQVGVSNIKADLMPEDKLTVIKEVQRERLHVAMGGAGTDTALETADIALMSDDFNKIKPQSAENHQRKYYF